MIEKRIMIFDNNQDFATWLEDAFSGSMEGTLDGASVKQFAVVGGKPTLTLEQ